MSICRIYEMRGASLSAYDQVTAAAGDVVAAGGTLHIAGANDEALYVIEVWPDRDSLNAWLSSQAEANELQEQLLPMPRIAEFEVHNALGLD